MTPRRRRLPQQQPRLLLPHPASREISRTSPDTTHGAASLTRRTSRRRSCRSRSSSFARMTPPPRNLGSSRCCAFTRSASRSASAGGSLSSHAACAMYVAYRRWSASAAGRKIGWQAFCARSCASSQPRSTTRRWTDLCTSCGCALASRSSRSTAARVWPTLAMLTRTTRKSAGGVRRRRLAFSTRRRRHQPPRWRQRGIRAAWWRLGHARNCQ
mmetsp:Transcript_6053/g.15727  ORF Transcript_6053/g.15727 Transcript_6053/m.15727 type:complete len:214 (+) Transcript_6053:728-1369(+)